MKRLLWSLMPDSFLGRLVAAMVLAVAFLFIINIYAVCYIQVTFSTQAEKSRSDTVASFFLLLSALGDNQRYEVVDQASHFRRSTDRSVSYAVLPENPNWNTAMCSETRRAVNLLMASLSNNNIKQMPQIQARVINKGDQTPDRELAALVSTGKFPLLQIAIRMDDAGWLSVIQPLYVDDPQVLWLQRMLILAEFLAFTAIVLLLLKRATNPLRDLTQAVETFGTRPETSPPLPEEGSRELREAAQSFNRMRNRISGNLAERDRMLAAMGHDLRTPLTRAQLRLDDVKPEPLRDKIRANITEIESIIEQGLELAGSLQSSEEPVLLDIVSLLQSMVDDSVAQGKAADMQELPAGVTRPLRIFARPLCLKRCLDNLLSNALKYGGNAQVSVSQCTEESITIEVLDDGPGIPEQFLEQVFEPYYRLESSRNRSSGGTGLGLSIARNMALLNKGMLTLHNRPEGGLRARLVLPRYRREKPDSVVTAG